jgi:hypothetical protein
VIPAHDNTSAPTGLFPNSPEELAEAGQILVGGKQLVGTIDLFDVNVGHSGQPAGQETTSEKAVAPFDLLLRVISHIAKDVLFDKQLVPMRLGATVLPPPTRQPEDGPFCRPLAPRDPVLGFIIAIELGLRRRFRRRNPLGQVVEELRQSPIGHDLLGKLLLLRPRYVRGVPETSTKRS